MDAFEALRLARRDDPSTSKEAAQSLGHTAATMRANLLSAFGRGSWTAEEAATQAGYTAEDGSWKRVSDLKSAGFIAPTGAKRLGSKGKYKDVLAITQAGREELG